MKRWISMNRNIISDMKKKEGTRSRLMVGT